MTDRDTKKTKETARPKGLVSSTHERSTAPDRLTQEAASRLREARCALLSGAPVFEDDGLDELLEKSLGEIAEPRLLLRERLLNGTRIRREV